MANGLLGLVFQIDADPSNASAALEAFAAKTGQSVGYVKAQFQDYQAAESAAYAEAVQRARGAGQAVKTSMTDAEENARLLSEMIGVHMPRTITRGLGQMMPMIGTLTTGLMGLWAVSQIEPFLSKLKEAITDLAGYTDEVRKAEKADIDASTAALIHFKTIAQGTLLIAQTNAALANLAAKQGNWQEVAKAANAVMSDSKSVWLSLLGPLTSVIALYRGYKAAVQESSGTESEAAKLRERLMEQFDQMTKLQDQAHKDAARTAKEEAEAEAKAAREAGAAWEHSSEQSYEYYAQRRKQTQEEFDDAVRLSEKLIAADDKTREVQEQTNAYFQEQAARMAHEREEEITKGLEQADRRIQEQFKQLEAHAKQLQIQWANAHPLAANIIQDLHSMGIEARSTSLAKLELSAVTAQFTRATIEEMMAVQKSIAASGEQLASGLAGLIGGRKAQAGVEAIWETARGIAMLAEGAWPPNPAALIAAGLHFEAAAQYAMIAGSAAGMARLAVEVVVIEAALTMAAVAVDTRTLACLRKRSHLAQAELVADSTALTSQSSVSMKLDNGWRPRSTKRWIVELL